ncbi:MAG: hypothetical protein ACO1N0_17775 [Fluviicola sp.]
MIKILKKLSLLTKWTIGIGLIHILYGYAARIIPINFFWESIYVGFFFLIIGAVSHLVTMIKSRKKNKQNAIGVKIALGFVIFLLATQVFMSFMIPNSEAYSAAKKELSENPLLQKDVGKITGFGFIPIAQLLTTAKDPIDYSGDAYFNIIVKGSKKYVFLSVTMHKNYGEEWKIIEMD